MWQAPDGSVVPSCTIITTEPNELIREIHNRMPVILREDWYREWVKKRPEGVAGLLRPYPASEMMASAVSRLVNNPRNDVPECVAGVYPGKGMVRVAGARVARSGGVGMRGRVCFRLRGRRRLSEEVGVPMMDRHG